MLEMICCAELSAIEIYFQRIAFGQPLSIFALQQAAELLYPLKIAGVAFIALARITDENVPFEPWNISHRDLTPAPARSPITYEFKDVFNSLFGRWRGSCPRGTGVLSTQGQAG